MTPKLIPVLLEPPVDNSNTIFVDDVRIEDGVYTKNFFGDTYFIIKKNNGVVAKSHDYENSELPYIDLKDAMMNNNRNDFFTLSGKRIVPEKQEQGEYILAKDADMNKCIYVYSDGDCYDFRNDSIFIHEAIKDGYKVYQVQFS